jgi:Leucine-rich repeat (LRR) protein
MFDGVKKLFFSQKQEDVAKYQELILEHGQDYADYIVDEIEKDFQFTGLHLHELKSVTYLKIDISKFDFNIVNENIKYLQSLYTLEFTNVSKIPNSVYTLKNLEHLCINGCGTNVEVSEDIQNLEKLEEFYMFNCGLTEIPKAIYKSKSIEKLSFVNNKISNISCEIMEMQKLFKLNLSKNFAISVPQCLSQSNLTIYV